jgi:hypothetical protein
MRFKILLRAVNDLFMPDWSLRPEVRRCNGSLYAGGVDHIPSGSLNVELMEIEESRDSAADPYENCKTPAGMPIGVFAVDAGSGDPHYRVQRNRYSIFEWLF